MTSQGHQGLVCRVNWRYVALWKSIAHSSSLPARDALATLLRENGKDGQAVALIEGELMCLSFASHQIGDCGAQNVADFLMHDEMVGTLWLRSCNIGPHGLKAISEALKYNHAIKSLNVTFNQIGDEGAKALISALNHNVCITALYLQDQTIAPKLQGTIEYLTDTRNNILIPAVVRRASLFLIAARRNITSAGGLAIFPKEIVKMIAMEVWATRKEPIWINALTESERTGESGN
jgi:hypothetical protein